MKTHSKLPWGFTALLLGFGLSAPVHAQWITHDPINGAQLLISNAKLVQQIAQSATMISQGLKFYTLASQETTALRNREFMQAAGYLSNVQIPGQPGWTMALHSASGLAAANTTWRQMIQPGTALQTLQSRIHMADAFGSSMIDSVGGCSASAVQSNGALGRLQGIVQSVARLDNTQAALGGATNVALTHMLSMQQCQHNVQLQQAQIQMLSVMRQRDYDDQEQSMYTHASAIAASTPTGVAQLSNSLYYDLP